VVMEVNVRKLGKGRAAEQQDQDNQKAHENGRAGAVISC
jgi:hypothetical protein